MKASDNLLMALAHVVEYQLRGERDKGLQALRLDLKRAIALLATKEKSKEKS